MAEVNKREIGEGNFSIGSAVKGGLISVKIDFEDMEKTRKVIQEARDLHKQLAGLSALEKSV